MWMDNLTEEQLAEFNAMSEEEQAELNEIHLYYEERAEWYNEHLDLLKKYNAPDEVVDSFKDIFRVLIDESRYEMEYSTILEGVLEMAAPSEKEFRQLIRNSHGIAHMKKDFRAHLYPEFVSIPKPVEENDSEE